MNSNNVKFYLNILEISGKEIANIYVNDIRHKLDNRKLKYHFDIITDEDFYNVRKHTMRGGKTTFPYNHFENTFNNMRNIIQFNKDSTNESTYQTVNTINHTSNDTIDKPDDDTIDKMNDDTIDKTNDDIIDKPDNDTIDKTNDDTIDKTDKSIKELKTDTDSKSIVDRLVSYNPLELNDIKTKSFTKITKTEPIKLDIPNDYSGVIHILLTINVTNKNSVVEGGITQLNQFLQS